MTLPPLVSATALHDALDRPGLRILDASTDLVLDPGAGRYVATPQRDAFRAAHIPGAVFADVVHDLADPGAELAFTVPGPDRFAEQIGRLGVGDDSQVVVYASGGAWATRLWWLLRLHGLDRVSVLDGGLPTWQAAGLPVESGDVEVAPATFTPAVRPELLATIDEVAALPGRGCLVNALDPATFRGEQPVNPYPRRGRIPGSTNLPASNLIDPETGRFRPAAEMRELLDATGLLGPGRAVTYCGGGIAATLPAFAAYVAGNPEVAVYDGSLSEWTADPDRPVELG